jgi:hypothetical protein
MLDKAYSESKHRGAPNKKNVCITCSAPIGRRLGDFSKSDSTCKLCFGHVCHACRVTRKLSFVDPDLQLSKRKVTFCTTCEDADGKEGRWLHKHAGQLDDKRGQGQRDFVRQWKLNKTTRASTAYENTPWDQTLNAWNQTLIRVERR